MLCYLEFVALAASPVSPPLALNAIESLRAMPFGRHGDLMKMWNGKKHGDVMKTWNGKTREFGICSLLQRFANSWTFLLTLASFC